MPAAFSESPYYHEIILERLFFGTDRAAGIEEAGVGKQDSQNANWIDKPGYRSAQEIPRRGRFVSTGLTLP